MNATAEVVEQEKKVSMAELLGTLNKLDDGLIDLDIDGMKELAESTKIKVDGYKEILDAYEDRIARLKKDSEELAKAKKTLENKCKSLRLLLLFNMKSNKFTKLSGIKYNATLITKKDIKITVCHMPTSKDFLNSSEFVKRDYSWNKKALKEELKKNPESKYKHYGESVEVDSIRFSINKGDLS